MSFQGSLGAVVKFRPSLISQRLILHENTAERLVLIEKPHYVYAIFFFLSGCVLIGLLFYSASLAIPGIAFLALGLWGMVRSTFTVRREKRTFEVQRRLGWLRSVREYPVAEIARTFERKSIRGTLLRIEFVSGKRKNLTLWADYLPLTGQVALLNAFLRSL
jgi:hypothetical protein